MDHGRLHWYEPEELDEQQRRVYDAIVGGPRAKGPQLFERADGAGRLFGPFNAMLVDPAVGEVVQELGTALRFRAEIPARCREIAILEVAGFRRSEYEWYAHRETGYALGLGESEIEAIRDGGSSDGFSDQESCVREVVQSLLRERDLSEELFRRAVEDLGTRLLTDLVYLVGYYEAVALSLSVFNVPLPPGVDAAF